MNDDRDLLAHYVARGRDPWNVSLEAAWLDVQMRTYVEARIPPRRPLRACNVGIGVGLWDDWLGHVVRAPITSIDRDETICRLLAVRQAREDHPYPARILCGDVLDGVLSPRRFDVITCVGSTIAETSDAAAMRKVLCETLVDDGLLLVCEVSLNGPTIVVSSTSTDARGQPVEPAVTLEMGAVAPRRIGM